MISSLKKSICLLLLTILITGCATSYQSKGFTGGFSETQLDENVFQVFFEGNAYTSSQRAIDFTLLRSAELTTEHGFDFFVIVDSQNSTNINTVTSPITSQTSGSAHVSGNHIFGSSTTRTTGGQTTVYSRPSTRNTIVMFRERPEISAIVYSADFVRTSIRNKYRMSD